MRWLDRLTLRLRSLLFKKGVERELDAELQSHLQRQIETNIAAGMVPQQARRLAIAEFGGVENWKEECRDARGTNRIETLVADLGYGLRMLRKNPGFAAIAVVTLALGIGANTAIFSMVNALLLHPYPFHALDRLVIVWEDRGVDEGFDSRYIAPADAADLDSDTRIFDALSTYDCQSFNLSARDGIQPELGCAVSADFFDVLGVAPSVGRAFTLLESKPGSGSQAALLGYGLWQREFGGDPNVLGRAIRLSGRTYTVVGVMPAKFNFPAPTQLWVPLALSDGARRDRSKLSLQALGRLQPGVGIKEAQAAVASVASREAHDFPSTNSGRRAQLLELRKQLYLYTVPLFLMLQAAAGFVLLLACANLANLLFARMIARHREVAVRTALGASRQRLVQLLICETVLLSFLAALAAVALSFGTVRLLRTSISPDWTMWVPGWDGIHVDRAVLIATVLLGIAVGIIFGIASAAYTGRVELNRTLKETGSISLAPGKGRIRNALVVVQVVLALVLLVCAALTIKGFTRVAAIYQGFQPRNVLRAEFHLPDQNYATASRMNDFYREVLRAAAGMPGATSAAFITNTPASNVDNPTTFFTIEGRPALQTAETPSADLQTASPDYFQTLHIPLIAGRGFSDSDDMTAAGVALISQSMASQFWPAGDALGHRIKLGKPDSDKPWLTIAGIVADVRQNWWDPPAAPTIYQPLFQAPDSSMTFVMRVNSDPKAYVSSLRNAVVRMDPDVVLEEANTLEAEVADSIAIIRVMGILMGIFGFVALALSAVGVYGVLSENVAQRTHEIGIRLALGATRRDVMKLILGYSLRLTAIGLAVALPVAYLASRAMSQLVFGITAISFPVLATFALVLIAAAVGAAYLPARRAIRLDPMIVLRYE
jgi:putative ABC transport system permease protein